MLADLATAQRGLGPETPWYKRWFSTPSHAERDCLPLPKIATPASNSVAQICRTKPQDDERSILEHYL